MANQNLTITMITKESLRVLHNNLVYTKGVDRQYSNEFAKTGAKIGSTVNVRMPNTYYVRTGKTVAIQDNSETYVPVTLTTQYGVDFNFSSAELSLDIDAFSTRYITPAMARLSSQIDFDGLALAKKVYNNVGVPGSPPGTSGGSGIAISTCPEVYLNAGMLMDNSATPRDNLRSMIINPRAQAKSITGLSGLFQDSNRLAEQYRNGVMGQALGFEFGMDQNVNTLTCGTRAATAAINGAGQTGATLSVSGLGASATVKAGEKFSIASVNSVNPENQQDTGLSAQFTVLSDATANASGVASLSISPSITVIGSTVSNGTVTAGPANGAVVTWIGTASTTYPMNLAYHRDFCTLATCDLPLPRDAEFAAREVYDGISMRFVSGYDINNDNFIYRIDVLAGWAVLRPAQACVVWG